MASRHRNPPTFGLSASHNGLTPASKAHFSAWTPVNHVPSNEQLYIERRALIGHWFDMWTHGQRKDFLQFILQRSTSKQQRYAFNFLDPQVPPRREDFVNVLPRFLTMYIFSFLDARSLCRASCVNWHWHFLAEQDALWQPKAIKYGWYLPYSPCDKEYGAWKRHYVACLNTLDRSSPNQQIADLYATLGGLTLTSTTSPGTGRKNRSHRLTTDATSPRTPRKSPTATGIPNALRRPWLDPDPKPRDLEKGWESIQSTGAMPPSQTRGLHHSTFSASSKAYSLAAAASLHPGRTYDASSYGDDASSEASSDTIASSVDPAQSTLVKLSDLIKQQASSAYDSVALSSTWPTYTGAQHTTGFDGNLSQSTYLSYRHDLRALVQRFPSHSHPSIILISSQIPAAEILLNGLIFGVLPLVYDYASSSIESLVERLDYLLAGRQARSIGLFVECSEGQLKVVEGETTSASTVQRDTNQRYLWESLCSRCIPSHDGGRLDLFAALASNAHGMELISALQRFTGYQISASRSMNNKREFVDSDWVIVQETCHSSLSPPALYFNLTTLATWTNTSLYLENAISTAHALLQSYLRGQRKDLIVKTVGKVIIEALSLHDIAAISRKLARLLVKAIGQVAMDNSADTNAIVQSLARFFTRQAASKGHGGDGKQTAGTWSPNDHTSADGLFADGNQRQSPPQASTPVLSRNKAVSVEQLSSAVADPSADGGYEVDDGGSVATQSSSDVASEHSEMDKSFVPPSQPAAPRISPSQSQNLHDSTFRLSVSSRHIPNMPFTDGRTAAPRVVSFQDADAQDWMEQRHSVAMEMGRTEKVYHRCLLSISENFHQPLRNAAVTGKAIITLTNVELIFTDTEILLQIAKQTDAHLQSKLNSWTAYQCLGDVFARFTSSLQSYVNFANNYPTTLTTIMRCQEDSPAFRAFLKQQCGLPQSAMLNLFELFLLPAQRIASYVHLINTFKVLTPPDHPDHQQLDVSIGRLERMKALLLESKERSMRERRLEALQKTILGCPVLQEGQRYLLYEDTFQHLVHSNYGKAQQGRSRDGPIYLHVRDIGLFLFTDSLLVTGVDVRHYPFERAISTCHRYTACFALDSLSILDMADSKEKSYAFTLTTTNGKERWICRALSQHAKLGFLSAVQKAIESQPAVHF